MLRKIPTGKFLSKDGARQRPLQLVRCLNEKNELSFFQIQTGFILAVKLAHFYNLTKCDLSAPGRELICGVRPDLSVVC